MVSIHYWPAIDDSLEIFKNKSFLNIRHKIKFLKMTTHDMVDRLFVYLFSILWFSVRILAKFENVEFEIVLLNVIIMMAHSGPLKMNVMSQKGRQAFTLKNFACQMFLN